MSGSLRAIVVTGMSGSGKSTALHVLEDLGFYCVDNLPVALLPRFVELWESSQEEVRRVALGIDVRAGRFLRDFPRVFEELRAAGVALEVLYLEANDDVLVRRFSETRRPHPAAESGAVADGIRRERETLQGLREVADRIVDTSALTVHELRAGLRDLVARAETGTTTVSLVSFGYKYGLPSDADLVIDVRFLPNPHYERDLRPLTGEDPRILEYINREGELDEFYERLHPLLDYLLPQYLAEGKAHLVVAIGCTGGRHRSVAIARHLGERYGPAKEYLTEVVHRDVDRLV